MEQNVGHALLQILISFFILLMYSYWSSEGFFNGKSLIKFSHENYPGQILIHLVCDVQAFILVISLLLV